VRCAYGVPKLPRGPMSGPRPARLVLETPGRFRRIPTARPRAFNHVLGFEAVPFEIPADSSGKAVARIHVRG